MAGNVNKRKNYSAVLASNPVFTVDFEDPLNLYYSDAARSNRDFSEITKCILRLFDFNDSKATFFVLGKVADFYPDLLKMILDKGHEIACHGYEHRRLDLLGEKQFEEDTQRACEAIMNACGIAPVGYRAPWFSLKKENFAFYSILNRMGFKYSSSVRHKKLFPELKTIKDFPRYGEITEFPYNYSSIFNLSVPISGGAVFRFLPFFLYSSFFDRIVYSGSGTFFYIHPADFGVKFSEPQENGLEKFVKYYNSNKTELKITRLLAKHRFESFINILKADCNERC